MITLSACGAKASSGTDIQTAPTTATTASGTPAPSASATSRPATPEAAARAGAIAAVRKYYATIDQLYSNPKSSYNLIVTVSTGNQADIDRNGVAHYRSQSWKQTGTQKISTIAAGVTDLTNQPAHKPDPIYPTVQVTTCNDVSKVGGVDANGNSLVAAGRKNFLLDAITVTNLKYPAANGWRVSNITNKGADSCPAQ
ncbi:MAG: uncharacterized protein JWN95_3014 [Frankiales bacterium]|nr:uncharacterized protein [Frankiales bacterium]